MFKLIKNNEIQYFVSDIFPKNLVHAFTTRLGGYAPEPLNSFSMGTAQFKEHHRYIHENRKLVCSSFNLNYDMLVMTDQKHTDNVCLLETKMQANENGFLDTTDAVITVNKEIPVLLFFADCVPIMIYDTKNKVMALIHAGWKGTEKKIVAKAAQKIINTYKTSPENMLAAIGPSIGVCCYEVNPDVARLLLNSVPTELVSDKIIKYKNDRPHIDLKQINALQLRLLGIDKIDISAECTSCNTDMFFSHRATSGNTGRQSLIAQLN
jgi:polyphenol oxidase